MRSVADSRAPAAPAGELQTGARLDGLSAAELVTATGAPSVILLEEVSSTMDAAHEAAAGGAPAGTLVIAERQTRGRGRLGNEWQSREASGLWLTMIERPRGETPLELISIRIGLALAAVLDSFVPGSVSVKWPNDLYLAEKKLGGILIETRWRDRTPEWVAIGVGINITEPPDFAGGAWLNRGVSRADVLGAIAKPLREAAQRTDLLSASELEQFARRDRSVGRRCLAPVRGVVRGITSSGELLVYDGSSVVSCRSGSLVLDARVTAI